MLQAEQNKVLRHREEVITDYKVSIKFIKGLERLGVASYQFKYLIVLACFKARYPEMKLEENPFINYLEDQNVQIESKMSFDYNLDSLPRLNA